MVWTGDLGFYLQMQVHWLLKDLNGTEVTQRNELFNSDLTLSDGLDLSFFAANYETDNCINTSLENVVENESFPVVHWFRYTSLSINNKNKSLEGQQLCFRCLQNISNSVQQCVKEKDQIKVKITFLLTFFPLNFIHIHNGKMVNLCVTPSLTITIHLW